MKRVLVAAAVLLFCLSPAFADLSGFYYNFAEAFEWFADPNTGLTAFPTLLIPLGGRLEGMGTAYTAVSDDAGYLESNPSASSTLEKSELSFYHHSWIADSNLEGVVYTMRFKEPLEDLGIGFGGKFLFLPFTEYNEWGDRESRGYISESIATMNVSYNFLRSYSFYGLAVGANLKAAYRSVPTEIYPDQSVLTGMIDVGLLTRVNFLKFFISRSKNFSVGAVIKNLGLPALGDPLPTMATFGIAYSALRPVTWAFDFNLPFSLNPSVYPAEQWFVASGLSVTVTDFLSLQGGFQLRGDNPRISLGSAVDLDKVSFVVNYNLDLSGRLNPADKFSVEAKLHLGDRGRAQKQRQVDELYLEGLEAYANGRLSEAISKWNEALALDPGFLPARENIATAERALRLQQEMDDQLELE
ncbi:MAG: UPF0164 family protein [Spirochaetales bacterium]|nr:UPF0164 family protein [Spirochaetales bacterium]